MKPLVRDFNTPKIAIATAGTVKNLARIHCKIAHNTNLSHVDGYQLSLNDIRETSARLLALASPEAIKESSHSIVAGRILF